MAKYYIHEGRIDKLEKKLAAIEKKCKAYGCEFKYSRTGNETFKAVKVDGTNYIVKFIEVEAEGTALINGWRFVATIEHKEVGNIVRQLDEAVEIPERYYHTSPVCEHCHTARVRKDTFLVYNEVEKEFKQVGRACLKSYTGGLDADQAAAFTSWFDTLAKGYEVETSDFGHVSHYFNMKEMLIIAHQVVTKYGYVKREAEYQGKEPTADLVKMIYMMRNSAGYERYSSNFEKSVYENVNIDDPESQQFVEAALAWLATNNDSVGYMANLRAACLGHEYIEWRDTGLVVSLVPTYLREVSYQQKKIEVEMVKQSSHFAKVGDKVEFDTKSIKVLSGYEDIRFGFSYFYQLIDTDDNVYTWSTGTYLNTEKRYHIKGTVKKLNEFRGIKQTQITRCKASVIEEPEPAHVPYNPEAENALNEFLEWCEA